jgi:hypothetical protein
LRREAQNWSLPQLPQSPTSDERPEPFSDPSQTSPRASA